MSASLDPWQRPERQTCEYWVRLFRCIHPKPSAQFLVEQAIAQQFLRLTVGSEFEAFMEGVQESLVSWVNYWRGNGVQFAPRLERWLAEESWTKQPPAPPATARRGGLALNLPLPGDD